MTKPILCGVVVVAAIAISTVFLPTGVAVILDSAQLRTKDEEHIIPVPSAAQLRYQSTDFVGKQ